MPHRLVQRRNLWVVQWSPYPSLFKVVGTDPTTTEAEKSARQLANAKTNIHYFGVLFNLMIVHNGMEATLVQKLASAVHQGRLLFLLPTAAVYSLSYLW